MFDEQGRMTSTIQFTSSDSKVMQELIDWLNNCEAIPGSSTITVMDQSSADEISCLRGQVSGMAIRIETAETRVEQHQACLCSLEIALKGAPSFFNLVQRVRRSHGV